MNGARGEVTLCIDGRERTLCLTLGALAEIETAFGCSSLSELQVRMRRLSAAELMQVLAVLLKGGGEQVAPEQLSAMKINPGLAARAVAEAFRAAVG